MMLKSHLQKLEALACTSLVAFTLAACDGAGEPNLNILMTGVPLVDTIDPGIAPTRAPLTGKIIPGTNRRSDARPIGAVQDSLGRRSEFVMNEMIVWATDPIAAQSIATRLGGTLITANTLFTPSKDALADQANRGRAARLRANPAFAAASPFLIQLPDRVLNDDSDGHITRFKQIMQGLLDRSEEAIAREEARMRENGKEPAPRATDRAVTISSEPARRLLALVAREAEKGLQVSVNFVAEFDSVLTATREQPAPANISPGANSLNWLEFASIPPTRDSAGNRISPNPAGAGSGSNVSMAWQLIAADNFASRVRSGDARPINLAIIDGGYNLAAGTRTHMPDPNAMPSVVDLGGPNVPVQFDYADGDSDASGTNPGNCGSGNPCPFHGAGVASTALGLVNNGAGAAGSGGTVGVPMLFRFDLSDVDTLSSIREASYLGADIINMSYGSACDNIFCRFYRSVNGFNQTFSIAIEEGVILVAAAGNRNYDSAGNDYRPCMTDGVICVGALRTGSQIRARSYSNYGRGVDIWSPGTITTWPDTNGTASVGGYSGTSAAAPFVSGVIAMMKAFNPALNSATALQLLQRTAWPRVPEVDIPSVVDSNGNLINYGPARRVFGRLVPISTQPIDAYSAVLAAAEGRITPDRLDAPTRSDQSSQTIPISVGQTITDLNLDSPSDFDYFSFYLPDYSAVTVQVNYMSALGEPSFVLNPMVGTGRPEEIMPLQRMGNTITYRAESLAPGYYRILISSSSSGPNGYSLRVDATPRGLRPDAFELQRNESIHDLGTSLPTASLSDRYRFANGTHQVNFHNEGDYDYYRVRVQSVTELSRFRISISHCDRPVDLVQVDGSGLPVIGATAQRCIPGTASTPTRPAEIQAILTADGRDIFLQVTPTGSGGQRITRYTLSAQQELNLHVPAYETEPVIELDFNAPQPHWSGVVDNEVQLLAFRFLQSPPNFLATLTARGLHAELLNHMGQSVDAAGNPVASTAKNRLQGVPSLDGLTEQFGIEGLLPRTSGPYVILLRRTNELELNPAGIPYSLDFAVQR